MDYLGIKNVASMMRHFDFYYQEALELLVGRLKRHNGYTEKP